MVKTQLLKDVNLQIQTNIIVEGRVKTNTF